VPLGHNQVPLVETEREALFIEPVGVSWWIRRLRILTPCSTAGRLGGRMGRAAERLVCFALGLVLASGWGSRRE
jgi:hypothetical protein